MLNLSLDVPVVLIIFNRPETTKRVFSVLRQIKPTTLFVIADGYDERQPDLARNCAATRAIIDTVNWECEIIKNYSRIHMGCKKRICTGLDWVFEQVDEAIILEDDCLPTLSFFRFCNDLLNKYKNNDQIYMISGTNQLEEWKSTIQSYHYSNYAEVWGWATWKRAWRNFDIEMNSWTDVSVREYICKVLVNQDEFEHRSMMFDKAYKKEVDAWSFHWSFTRLSKNSLSIVPSRNLVSNIGFSKNATHTIDPDHFLANIPSYEISFPLRVPIEFQVDHDYDRKLFLKFRN